MGDGRIELGDFEGKPMVRSPLQVGRELKKQIKTVKNDLSRYGVEISPEQERKTIRHEVAHALGADPSAVVHHQVGAWITGVDKDYRFSSYGAAVATTQKDIGNVGSGLSRMRSAIAPLGDRRVKQQLSSADKISFLKGFLRIFGIK